MIYELSFVGIKTIRYTEFLSIALRVNGIPVTYASADALKFHSFHTRVFFQSILKIKIGDRVDIFMEKEGLYDDNDQHTHFTGKLLFAMNNEKHGNHS